jgi:hypothetical protein
MNIYVEKRIRIQFFFYLNANPDPDPVFVDKGADIPKDVFAYTPIFATGYST